MSTRDRKKRQSRRQWLAAGRACFARDGFAATTVDALAAEAGLSRPGFFLYFPSKAALCSAIRLEMLQALTVLASQEMERDSGSDGLARSLSRIHRYLLEQAAVVRGTSLLAMDDSGEDAGRLAVAWGRLARQLAPSMGEGTGGVLAESATAGLLQGAWRALLGGTPEPAVRQLLGAWLATGVR